MAPWTVPRTWVANEKPTAAIMNIAIRDNQVVIGVHSHDGSAGEGNDELTGLDSLTFDDIGAPAAYQWKRDGAHLYWHNNTKVIALTEPDAAAATPSPRTVGTGALQASPGDHGHGFSGYVTAGETVLAATATGQSVLHLGRYTVNLSTTITYDDVTKAKKVAAYHALMMHVQNVSDGNLKISIDVDGIEQTSYTVASSNTGGNIHLLALAVKNTADIRFEVFIENAGTDANLDVTMSSHAPQSSSSSTTNPTGQTSIVDLDSA